MIAKGTFLTLFDTYIQRPGAQLLKEWLTQSDFFTAPASTRYHGSHTGGLCEHSVHVWERLMQLLTIYPQIKTSPETAAIASLLHDVCKIGCYKTEMRNKKENGVWVQVPFYTFSEDFPYGGHGSKSVFLIERFIRLTEEEAVAINCHMGFSDRAPGDYSLGKAYERYPLAWLLHVADEAASYLDEKFEEEK